MRTNGLFLGVLMSAVLAVPSTATGATSSGRVIAEPEERATYIQHNLEYRNMLRDIEALSPRFMEIYDAAVLAPNAGVTKSANGHTIWVVRITDENVATPKKQVAATLSLHGDEPAGREGGLRFVEDLVRWGAYNPSRQLRAGNVSISAGDWLRANELWLSVPNPDGWVKGELTNPFPTFWRENGNGYDLNRQFATQGWRTTTPLHQPEAKLWSAVLSGLPNLKAHLDVHGETSSPTGSFMDVMWPSAQWAPQARRREWDFANRIVEIAERRMAELMPNGELRQRFPNPASAATAYDIVGYDGAGFLGDWMAQRGVLALDVEVWPNIKQSTVGAGPPSMNTAYSSTVERLRVTVVRAALEALLVTSAVPTLPTSTLGGVVVVDDGVRSVTADRLRWFDELATDTATPVSRLPLADVSAATLAGADTVVLADVDAALVNAATATALRNFADAGGQLLLTDRSLALLPAVGVAANVQSTTHIAGHVNFGEHTHAWEQGLPRLAKQTYSEVPLGFSGAAAESPHWGVTAATWPGTSAATVAKGSDNLVALGETSAGSGRIAIFGAVLPQPRYHTSWLGLADHGVTVAGGHVLENILAYRRP